MYTAVASLNYWGVDGNPYQLNVLWLDPNKPETFPSGLMEALTLHHNQDIHVDAAGTIIQDRLRKQMQADALSALTERDQEDEDGDGDIETTTLEKQKKLVEAYQEYNPDFLEEAVQFLRLQVGGRLPLPYFAKLTSVTATGSTVSRAFLSSDSLCILFLLRHGV